MSAKPREDQPEIWFEPEIVGCLRDRTYIVLFVVLRNRRAVALVDVVLDFFHIGLCDADGREYASAFRLGKGRMDGF